MNRIISIIALLAVAITMSAQGTIKGKVEDGESKEPLSYVTVKVSKAGQSKVVKGTVTDMSGGFSVSGLPYGKYDVQLSFVGYKSITKQVNLHKGNSTVNIGKVHMGEDGNQLSEVTVVGQQSSVKLEVDRKTYDVSNDLSNIGASASEALENIPSVEVDNDGNISLRGSTSVEVWINGKSSGLTSDNRGTILQQIPAESIDRIEVIDNPSAKYSAEGSAGIINIILKRDRKAGYYGSVQVGANSVGGTNTSVNLNTSSKWIDSYVSIGYRHREDESGARTEQDFFSNGVKSGYQNSEAVTDQRGNILFTRAGLTFHASKKDDLSLSGMFMHGGTNSRAVTPYHYGNYVGTAPDLVTEETHILNRSTTGRNNMNMVNLEFGYKHNFSDTHFIDFTLSHNRWTANNDNRYQDRTTYSDPFKQETASYQFKPMNVRTKNTELKLDYENKLSEKFTLQTGYNARFNRENTPQEAWKSDNYDGEGLAPDVDYYNRFKYDMDTHAFYANITMKFGKFGVMGGLRGEYWKVNTESYDYYQDHPEAAGSSSEAGKKGTQPFKKDFFELFPSLFLSYQLTERDQLQVNVTRRLRRPWGGQLNSFMNTRNASTVTFGNPQLTPEFSFSYQFNYLHTWDNHSLLLSAYYRPTTDVIQSVKYMIDGDLRTFQTNMNLSKRINSGMEMTLKNKIGKRLELTTTASAFYYKLNAFNYTLTDPLMGQEITVSGDSESRFSWNARVQANVTLPYDISVQLKANYRSKRVITQGERRPNYGIDLGVRKSFMNKKLTIAMNCRDLLNSRKQKSETSSDTFWQYSENWRHSRKFNFTVTWSFGNNKPKKSKPNGEQYNTEEETQPGEGTSED